VTDSAADAHGKLIRVLLVEDSPEDVLLTRESLKEAKVANELLVVDDGESALDFVNQRGDYEDAPRPDVIILDLNLPKKDGREVLQELKEDPELKHIPIVVLTTSTSDEDVLSSYKHHANAFVRKPVTLDRFLEITTVIDDFWLGIVTLPAR
jgi:CheY-like chemotaxis protein